MLDLPKIHDPRGNLTFIVLAATQMLGVGTTTVVSHAVGRKDVARARLVFNQSIVLGAIVGLVFCVIALAFRRAYATALSADAVTADLAADYLLWFIPAMALQFGIVAMSVDLLLGYTGLPSLGQAAYLGVGAYLTAILATKYGIGLGWDFWLVVALGMAAGAATVCAPDSGVSPSREASTIPTASEAKAIRSA